MDIGGRVRDDSDATAVGDMMSRSGLGWPAWV